MKTHFAPAERADGEALTNQIQVVSKNPVMNGLLNFIGGLLAVLNEQRQVVALNHELLEAYRIKNIDNVLGLRPGEMVECIHAHDMPGGCGTSEFCASCGAAIAIVSCLGLNQPVEKTCSIIIEKTPGEHFDLYLRVRAVPFRFDQHRFILLFLQDISKQQQWAAFERMFFHDIKNILSALIGTTELLMLESDLKSRELITELGRIVERLRKEVEMQSFLTRDSTNSFEPFFQKILIKETLYEMNKLFINHPLAQKRRLSMSSPKSDIQLLTDISLLNRVLGNMIINALEASGEGEQIEVWIEPNGREVTFCIWNQKSIPEDIGKRILQRNFSTKDEMGRGLGTYSMKIFGEKFLNGKVSFTSSPAKGTVFRLTLPVESE